jgi:C-terminal processing protease CtpA/Prc
MRNSKALIFVACVLIIFGMVGTAFAGDPLGVERGQMKAILRQVSSEMQKKFYDPGMKGLDWKALTAEAEQKINNAKSVSEMLTAIHMLVMKLDDSHTAFIPPGRNVKYKFGFNAKPFGDEVRVYSLKRKGAAEKAGLQIGDHIIAVNKFKPTRSNYDDMIFFYRAIRNAPALDLTIQRGEAAPFDLRVEAERKVEAHQLDVERQGDLTAWLVEEDERVIWHTLTFDGGIGYAQMRSFTWQGADFMSAVIDQSNPKKAIILDFRSNGGGLEETMKQFAGLFETEEKPLAEKIGRKKTEKVMIKPRRSHYTQPLFILIDSGTGSAAEVVARYLQLTKRAVLVGDHTAGAVTAAMMVEQEMGTDSIIPYATYIGMFKIVMPDGNVLEKVGVTPDVECIPVQKDVAEENDVCLAQTVQLARKALGMPEQADLKVKAFVDRDEKN